MKFTFDRDAMIKEISIAQEVIANKSPVSILSNILLIAENNTLTIKALSSFVNFTTRIPIDVQEEGSTIIYCDKFMSILSSLPSGEVDFLQEDIDVTIKPIAKRFKAKLKSQTSDKFPEFGDSNNVPFFEVPASEFKEMIKQTSFAVSTDPNKFFMTGCYLTKAGDDFVMVATDGRRLSCCTKKGLNIPDFESAIINTKILGLVFKHAPDEGNIQLSVIESTLFVKFANVEFQSALINGKYPNYTHVIPQNLTHSFQVNKEDFDSALKRTTIMINKKDSRLILKIRPGELELLCPESDTGEANEIIPCRYDGPNCTTGLNYSYLLDPLKVIESEDVVFEFNFNEPSVDGEEETIRKSLLIHGTDSSDYIHVIMPMIQ